MKTITIKLPEEEAKELNEFIARRNFPSKSEFIRNLIMEKLGTDKKEKMGWLILAQESMHKIWNTKKDDQIWSEYL